MSSTKHINDEYSSVWRFFESYLPNYSLRDDVLCDDILYRYIDGDDVCEDDLQWIKAEYNCDKKLIADELVKHEKIFFEESLRAYLEQQFAS